MGALPASEAGTNEPTPRLGPGPARPPPSACQERKARTVTQDDLRKLLEEVSAGKVSAEEAFKGIRRSSVEKLANAYVDHDRGLRCGFPEVIFCEGKRTDDIAEIARAILGQGDLVLATRASQEAYEAIRGVDGRAEYHEAARCVTVLHQTPADTGKHILVLSAGTADVPVAEEARVTAEVGGHRVETAYDVGVAGIHRLFAQAEKIQSADVIVVVAGMEGALPSVVAGLASCPVVAVPTSVGYGASFGGLAPLLTMLNSCAAGVSVVNIDNGFGAGYLASLIVKTKGTA